AVQFMVERGLPPEEGKLLQQRLSDTSTKGISNTPPRIAEKSDIDYSRDTTVVPPNEHVKKELRVYGSDFFSNPNLKFEPNIRIATPKNYVLGPDDEVHVILTGLNESSVKSKITPDGYLKVPYVGLVYLNGFTIEQATAQIRSKMEKVYPALTSGKTK